MPKRRRSSCDDKDAAPGPAPAATTSNRLETSTAAKIATTKRNERNERMRYRIGASEFPGDLVGPPSSHLAFPEEDIKTCLERHQQRHTRLVNDPTQLFKSQTQQLKALRVDSASAVGKAMVTTLRTVPRRTVPSTDLLEILLCLMDPLDLYRILLYLDYHVLLTRPLPSAMKVALLTACKTNQPMQDDHPKGDKQEAKKTKKHQFLSYLNSKAVLIPWILGRMCIHRAVELAETEKAKEMREQEREDETRNDKEIDEDDDSQRRKKKPKQNETPPILFRMMGIATEALLLDVQRGIKRRIDIEKEEEDRSLIRRTDLLEPSLMLTDCGRLAKPFLFQVRPGIVVHRKCQRTMFKQPARTVKLSFSCLPLSNKQVAGSPHQMIFSTQSVRAYGPYLFENVWFVNPKTKRMELADPALETFLRDPGATGQNDPRNCPLVFEVRWPSQHPISSRWLVPVSLLSLYQTQEAIQKRFPVEQWRAETHGRKWFELGVACARKEILVQLSGISDLVAVVQAYLTPAKLADFPTNESYLVDTSMFLELKSTRTIVVAKKRRVTAAEHDGKQPSKPG